MEEIERLSNSRKGLSLGCSLSMKAPQMRPKVEKSGGWKEGKSALGTGATRKPSVPVVYSDERIVHIR